MSNIQKTHILFRYSFSRGEREPEDFGKLVNFGKSQEWNIPPFFWRQPLIKAALEIGVPVIIELNGLDDATTLLA